MFTPLTYFWPSVMLVAPWAVPRMSPPKDCLPLRKFNLLCNECSLCIPGEVLFAHPIVSRTLVASLSRTQNITPISNTTFWNFEHWWMLWHRTVTFNSSLQNSISLEHIVQFCFLGRVDVECALTSLVAGAPCCRAVTRNLRKTEYPRRNIQDGLLDRLRIIQGLLDGLRIIQGLLDGLRIIQGLQMTDYW